MTEVKAVEVNLPLVVYLRSKYIAVNSADNVVQKKIIKKRPPCLRLPKSKLHIINAVASIVNIRTENTISNITNKSLITS